MGRYELKYTAEKIDELLESVEEKTIYNDATQSEHGLMSATDKSKLNSLPTSSQIDASLSGKVDKVEGKGLSENDYTDDEKSSVASAYHKPQSGVPKSDLEQSVQTSLSKADTALQSFTETDPTVPSWAKQESKPTYTAQEVGALPSTTVIPTVPAISTDIESDAASDAKTASPKAVKTFVENKGYGTYNKPSGGIPASDLASGVIPSVPVQDVTVGGSSVVSGGTAVIPAIPDVSNCVQKSNTSGLLKNDGTVDTTQYGTYSKPSGGIPASDLESGVIPTVPTISTDIETDKASDAKTASPKAVYDEVHPTVGSSMPSGGFLPNVVYNLGTLSGDTTFLMASATDNTIANIWYWTFDTPSTAPTITWPQAITAWNGGSAPTINASKHYEISVLNGVACYMEV